MCIRPLVTDLVLRGQTAGEPFIQFSSESAARRNEIDAPWECLAGPEYTDYHEQVDEERQPPPHSPSNPARARLEAFRTFGQLSSVGLSFVLAVVIGTAIGWWLDRITGWSPICFILFFLLGLVAGIRNVYYTTKKFMK